MDRSSRAAATADISMNDCCGGGGDRDAPFESDASKIEIMNGPSGDAVEEQDRGDRFASCFLSFRFKYPMVISAPLLIRLSGNCAGWSERDFDSIEEALL